MKAKTLTTRDTLACPRFARGCALFLAHTCTQRPTLSLLTHAHTCQLLVLLPLLLLYSLRAKGSQLLVLRGTPQEVLPRVLQVSPAHAALDRACVCVC